MQIKLNVAEKPCISEGGLEEHMVCHSIHHLNHHYLRHNSQNPPTASFEKFCVDNEDCKLRFL